MNEIKEILVNSLSRIDECDVCKAKLSDSEVRTGLCSKCEEEYKDSWKFNVGDKVSIDNKEWVVIERKKVDVGGEDPFFTNQYLLEHGEERKWIFEKKLNELIKDNIRQKLPVKLKFNKDVGSNDYFIEDSHGWPLFTLHLDMDKQESKDTVEYIIEAINNYQEVKVLAEEFKKSIDDSDNYIKKLEDAIKNRTYEFPK